MRIAITDACIFIDLYSLEIIAQFFQLNIEIHTSYDVINELYTHQQKVLKAFETTGKLIVHNLTDEERTIIHQEVYPKSLSENDKTVIHLAIKFDALLLSSDKAVRNYAKTKAIDHHGMLWIFDQLIGNNLLHYLVAREKLRELIMTNIIYQNNPELVREMNKRINQWKTNT